LYVQDSTAIRWSAICINTGRLLDVAGLGEKRNYYYNWYDQSEEMDWFHSLLGFAMRIQIDLKKVKVESRAVIARLDQVLEHLYQIHDSVMEYLFFGE
jgi:hypothetical protein